MTAPVEVDFDEVDLLLAPEPIRLALDSVRETTSSYFNHHARLPADSEVTRAFLRSLTAHGATESDLVWLVEHGFAVDADVSLWKVLAR